MKFLSKDEQLIPYAEFRAQKFNGKSETPVRHLLCLSETCFVERDPITYTVISARPLKMLISLVRDLNNPQLFILEYDNGDERSYLSNERLAIILLK